MFYWKEIDDLLESRPLVKTYLRKFVGKKLILFFFRWWDIIRYTAILPYVKATFLYVLSLVSI